MVVGVSGILLKRTQQRLGRAIDRSGVGCPKRSLTRAWRSAIDILETTGQDF